MLRSWQGAEDLVVAVLFGEAPISVHIFGSSTALCARGGPWTGGTLEFASLNEPTMAAFFHVNSSLVAGHNWRRPRPRNN